MNIVILVGNVTHEPEQLKSQVLRVRISLAVDNFAGKTDFIPVVIWGKLAEVCLQYFFRGIRLLVVGRLRIGRYKHKQFAEVIAQNVEFLSRKRPAIQIAEPKKINKKRKRAKAKATRLTRRDKHENTRFKP